MAARIRLKRAGSRHRPFYKIVVIDSRSSRDGSAIESLGHYDPVKKPEVLVINEERLNHWLSQGAGTSDSVEALLRRMRRRLDRGDALETKEAAAPAPSAEESSGLAEAGGTTEDAETSDSEVSEG